MAYAEVKRAAECLTETLLLTVGNTKRDWICDSGEPTTKE